jgi:hypothetical protein
MTFSREKKAQLRLQAAQQRKTDAARLQAATPPNKALKSPLQPKKVEVNKVNYGGHYKALNFTLQKGSSLRSGCATNSPKMTVNIPLLRPFKIKRN